MTMIKGKNIKEFVWRVVSDKMNKSIVVEVENVKIHPLYKKRFVSKKKFYAHDVENKAAQWSLVKIRETRPLSKLKRWELVDVLEEPK